MNTPRVKKATAANQSETLLEQANAQSDEVIQPTELDSAGEQPEANESNLEVILFSSTTCSPCKIVKPVLATLMEASKAKYTVLTIDPTDLDEETKGQFDAHEVTQVPTIICKKDGEEVSRTTGYGGKNQLVDFLATSFVE